MRPRKRPDADQHRDRDATGAPAPATKGEPDEGTGQRTRQGLLDAAGASTRVHGGGYTGAPVSSGDGTPSEAPPGFMKRGRSQEEMAAISAMGVEARRAKREAKAAEAAAAEAEAVHVEARPGESFFDVLLRKMNTEPERIIDQMLTSKNAVALARLAELAVEKGKPAEDPETLGLQVDGERRWAAGVGDVIEFMFEIGQPGAVVEGLERVHEKGLLVPALVEAGLLLEDEP